MMQTTNPISALMPEPKDDEIGENLLPGLIEEEKNLQYQIAVLDRAAQELRESGDDVADSEAAKIERQSSNAKALASEVSQAIQQVQQDPKKKLPRGKFEQLHLAVGRLVVIVDQEIGTAEAVQSEAEELKAETAHHVISPKLSSHGLEKKAGHSGKAKAKEKPKTEPKKLLTREGYTTPSLSAHDKNHAHSAWQTVAETAHHVSDAVTHSAPYLAASRIGHRIGEFVTSLPETLHDAAETVVEKTEALADGAARLAHKAGHCLKQAGKAVFACLPWSEDTPEPAMNALGHGASAGIMAALLADKNIYLPKSSQVAEYSGHLLPSPLTFGIHKSPASLSIIN